MDVWIVFGARLNDPNKVFTIASRQVETNRSWGRRFTAGAKSRCFYLLKELGQGRDLLAESRFVT